MKRFFILLLLLMAASVGLHAINRLHVDNFSIAPGETLLVSVELDNDLEFTAFQTDVTLTGGLSFTRSDEPDSIFVLSERASTNHSISCFKHDDNVFRVISFSFDVKPFSGNEGTLFCFSITADDDFSGPASISLGKTLFTTVMGDEVTMDDETCTVNKRLKGDVNGDGVVNISDINAVISVILSGNASQGHTRMADVNSDGVVNISDINMIISIILH